MANQKHFHSREIDRSHFLPLKHCAETLPWIDTLVLEK